MNREQAVQRLIEEQHEKRGIYAPEVARIEDVVTCVELRVSPGGTPTTPRVGLPVFLKNLGGYRSAYRGDTHVRCWTAGYVDVTPGFREAVAPGLFEALSVLEFIPWQGRYAGFGLLVGGDRGMIAHPWLTVLETEPTLAWFETTRDWLWQQFLDTRNPQPREDLVS